MTRGVIPSKLHRFRYLNFVLSLSANTSLICHYVMYAQFRAVLVKIVLESFLCEDLRRRNVRTSPTPHV